MISIITPVYNAKRFIEKCIQVVINQSCPEVEHVIIDGASIDGTLQIIENYALKYQHIRWLSEKDNGQSDALNKGVHMANGDILGILNVDDFYESNTLIRVSEIFNELTSPSLLVGNCNVWDDAGELLYINKPTKLKLTDLLLGWHINPHPVNPSAYFYHKSLHEKIGLYSEKYQIGQDLPFILSAVSAANVKYVNEIWGNYRLIEGTLTVEDAKSGLAEKRKNDIMRPYFEDLNLYQRIEYIIKKHYYENKNRIRNKLPF